jgi:cysteine desulfurase
MEIYLDNSATTKTRAEVMESIIDIYENNYGNPSSLHRMGMEIEKKIDWARKSVAKVINARTEEIYFTGGGTESNNIAILGYLSNFFISKCVDKTFNVITTKIEHPSVYNIFKQFESVLDVRYLDVDSSGKIEISELENRIDENTLLVSIMQVNNELGTVQDLDKIIEIVKSKNRRTKIHVDAIQAFGKMKVDTKKTLVDTMSFSSHKVHGPKGVGGLYVRSGYKINPIYFGASQENGIRPGTENTAGIVGFGKACELICDNFQAETEKLYNLKKQYGMRLIQKIDDIKINSDLGRNSAPHILSISFKNIRGEVLVHYLERKGIYVSTGSACSSKVKSDNRILKSIGLNKEYVDGTIRISFGHYNSVDEIEYVVNTIKQSVNEIRMIMK